MAKNEPEASQRKIRRANGLNAPSVMFSGQQATAKPAVVSSLVGSKAIQT